MVSELCQLCFTVVGALESRSQRRLTVQHWRELCKEENTTSHSALHQLVGTCGFTSSHKQAGVISTCMKERLDFRGVPIKCTVHRVLLGSSQEKRFSDRRRILAPLQTTCFEEVLGYRSSTKH